MNLTLRNLKSELKKRNFRMSDFLTSSRVRGWGNSTEGVSLSGLSPFRTYSRVYGTWTSDDKTHTASIKYTSGLSGFASDKEVIAERIERANSETKRLENTLDELGIKFKRNSRDCLDIEIVNHFLPKS